jgi:hypothetical protein
VEILRVQIVGNQERVERGRGCIHVFETVFFIDLSDFQIMSGQKKNCGIEDKNMLSVEHYSLFFKVGLHLNAPRLNSPAPPTTPASNVWF